MNRKEIQEMNIEERVKDVISLQLGIKKEEIKLESSFVKDLGADPLDENEVVVALEEEFGIDIDDEEAEKIITVGDAVNYIKKRIGNS